jgi:hypothetical protein
VLNRLGGGGDGDGTEVGAGPGGSVSYREVRGEVARNDRDCITRFAELEGAAEAKDTGTRGERRC